jgi:hypothetical protein
MKSGLENVPPFHDREVVGEVVGGYVVHGRGRGGSQRVEGRAETDEGLTTCSARSVADANKTIAKVVRHAVVDHPGMSGGEPLAITEDI